MEDDLLGGLEGLLRDLESFRENRQPNLLRLSQELEFRLDEFKSLIDQKPRNNVSRQKLSDGKIDVDGIVYEINEDFRQQAIQIADELDLDELDAAALFLHAQADALAWDRSQLVSAIIRFHKRRQFLVECLRLALQIAYDQDDFPDPIADDNDESNEMIILEQQNIRDEAIKQIKKFVALILNEEGAPGNSSRFCSQSLNAMKRIQAGIQKAAERAQNAAVIGINLSNDEEQILEFERTTLHAQHESLAIIATLFIRQGLLDVSRFRHIINHVKNLDKHDSVMLHYIPILMAAAAAAAGMDSPLGQSGSGPTDLHKEILAYPETAPWALRPLYNAFLTWWIVEYKGAFPDAPDVDQGSSPDSQALTKALRDGGLQFMLSISQDVKKTDWIDPAKVGLTNFLLRDATTLPPECPKISPFFQIRLMYEFQSFIEGFISNMPDTLRLLKFEEDDSRKLLRSRFQKNVADYQYDLDTFLLLIAYAFQDSPESAKSFWSEPDSNLYGFLQWAAQRQTTPRVAAFCEMLRSLSDVTECANHAHRFLLSESTPIVGKIRRNASLSWSQILGELALYSSSIKDRPAVAHFSATGDQQIDQLLEPESHVMLESYLRLITHLCYQSVEARTWLWKNEAFSITILLFQLCSSNVESRIRACAFSALSSLLFDKSHEISDNVWGLLDGWLSGGMSFSNNMRVPGTGSSHTEQLILEMIFNGGFEETNSFMQLLNGLIHPIPLAEDDLFDDLPYPQHLGSSYRLPGIENYIDFALGKVLAHKTTQVTDLRQLSLIRLNCLTFICTCLASFNEDLVIIANRSSLPVEKTLRSTLSLASYLQMHPFARVMEWLFDEKCIDAIFAAAHQDVNELNQADSASPLVLSTVRAIEVMNFVLRYQSTYLDIVKPIIRQNNTASSPPRKITSHATVASFEDGVLKHLKVLGDIGLYCGLGHSQLTLCSLSLLESLSASKRLNITPGFKINRHHDRNKLIAALEKDNVSQRISHSLATMMVCDARELEAGVLAPGYSLKSGILAFLKNCLADATDRPNIAHLTLGFTCNGNRLEIDNDGIFGTGKSLFHAVGRLALDYPDVIDGVFCSWAINIKESCYHVLEILCRSPLSSQLVMQELRLSDYVFWQTEGLHLVGPASIWDGLVATQPEFLLQESAVALRNLLRQRVAYYNYVSREFKWAQKNSISSLSTRIQSVLFGTTTFPGLRDAPNPNLLQLLDFMEIGYMLPLELPQLTHFQETDFAVCKNESSGSSDIARVQSVIFVKRQEFLSQKFAGNHNQSSNKSLVLASKEDKKLKEFDMEAQTCLCVFVSQNHYKELVVARFDALKSWIRLLVLSLRLCVLTPEERDNFVQQACELILPQFECSRNSGEVEIAVEFAELLNQLLVTSEADARESAKPVSFDVGSNINVRVFQAALATLTSQSSNLPLRQACYHLCSRFLRRLLQDASKSGSQRRKIVRNAKIVSDGLIDIICDDVCTGDAKTRIFALFMLEALVALSGSDEAKSILEPLNQLNFIGTMVDSVKQIGHDLGQVPRSEVPMVLAYHNACLAFLLRVAQSKAGALQLLNAGFFGAVKDSEIFATDPDIGFDIDSPEALKKFFDLMLSILRIINSIVLKYQTDQTKYIGQDFLAAYRPSIVGILKRFAGVGGAEFSDSIDLSDLVDNITVLISATEYLDIEDQGIRRKKSTLELFS